LRYATDVFTDWRANLRAIALGLEALRRGRSVRDHTRREQYAGWRAIEAVSGAGETLIDRGRRLITMHGGVAAAIKATHPDTGGNRHGLEAVLAARDSGEVTS
jgi:hypothetical protein